ncbi:MAG: RNA polymerase subunit sigma [Acidimicrobiales bacterium]|nr:MAG: RNA polymerase subunit sigma [Acidimicrobiales bacterium]
MGGFTSLYGQLSAGGRNNHGMPRQARGTRPLTGARSDAVEALLTKVAGDDMAAFGELYNLLASRVLGLACRLIRDRAQAEEFTQEVFVRVWCNANRYHPGQSSGVGWILSTTHYAAVDRIRTEQDRCRREDAAGQLIWTILVDDPVTDQFDTHAKYTELRSRLTSLQRHALVLAYYHDYTYEQVTRILRMPGDTAKTGIHGRLIRLRDCLTPNPPSQRTGGGAIRKAVLSYRGRHRPTQLKWLGWRSVRS